MAKKTFKIKDNLAQALNDTVNSAKNNAGNLHIEIIPLRKIELDPDNPRDLILSFSDLYNGITKNDPLYKRKNQEKKSLESITNSIIEQGVINPVVVYKFQEKYQLIAGERRTLASIMANKSDIPAKILVERPNSLQLSLLQWAENIERADLSLWERMCNLSIIIKGYKENRIKEERNISPTELSTILGCSLQQGVNYCNILSSSEQLMQAIKNNKIKSIDKAAIISKAPKELETMLIDLCKNGATINELKTSIKNQKQKRGSKKISTAAINLGFIQNQKVARFIFDSILKNSSGNTINNQFNDINWDDYKSINKAFKQLISLLNSISKEKEM